MGATTIEWACGKPGQKGFTVNPIRARIRPGGTDRARVGHYCEKISPGCTNCYSSAMQRRFGMPTFGQQRRMDVEHWFDDSKLEEVLRRRAPSGYFWCDMMDMFGEWISDQWIDKCFAAMALTQRHTHMVLTKRPQRMVRYFSEFDPDFARARAAFSTIGNLSDESVLIAMRRFRAMVEKSSQWGIAGPCPNIRLGVSVETPEYLWRIDELRRTPTACRFVSFEPLLADLGDIDLTGIDWAIFGLESGHSARPGHIDWIRRGVAQCRAQGVAPYVKQIGSNPRGWCAWNAPEHVGSDVPDDPAECVNWQASEQAQGCEDYGKRCVMLRDRKGGDMSEWPADLRIREFPKEAP